MAAHVALQILNAETAPLFPKQLTASEHALWCDVLEAADECIAEHRLMREAMRA